MPEAATIGADTTDVAGEGCPVGKRPLTEEERAFVEENRFLAVTMARKFAGRYPHVDIDDLISACHLGAIRAAKTWDPKVSKWGNYAGIWMKQAMDRAAIDDHLVHIPAYLIAPGRVARKHFSDQAERIRSAIHLEKGLEDLPGREAPAAEELERGEAIERLRAALRLLPETLRMAVVRVHMGGETYAAVAKDRGVTRQTVCNWCDRGMEQLRRLLGAGAGESNNGEHAA